MIAGRLKTKSEKRKIVKFSGDIFRRDLSFGCQIYVVSAPQNARDKRHEETQRVVLGF